MRTAACWSTAARLFLPGTPAWRKSSRAASVVRRSSWSTTGRGVRLARLAAKLRARRVLSLSPPSRVRGRPTTMRSTPSLAITAKRSANSLSRVVRGRVARGKAMRPPGSLIARPTRASP